MYTKKITDDDNFISLSSSAQALYFHLNQGADDDGFNNQIALAMYKAHASEDDLKVLMAKSYIIRFDSGVIVIKHWRMHNTLRKDRYTPTNFQEELELLGVKPNGAYTLSVNDGCQMVAKRLPNGCHSIGKYSKEEISKEEDRIGEDSVITNISSPDLEFSTINDVVKLTEDEITDLIDTMGISMFNEYTDKFATFIKEKDAHIKDHYQTILKWWKEDTAV